MFDVHSTIVALSSPAGSAGRAIVRLSGDNALTLAQTVFTPVDDRPLASRGGFRSVEGRLTFDSVALPARAYLFRAPRSYTRQDIVELHLPGHPLAAAMLLESLQAAGARPAQPGEFTLRAFLSGRIGLSQAQAVADLISAATDAQLRSANANAAGDLHRLCLSWTDSIASLLAEVEAGIDLADEDIELISAPDLLEKLTSLADSLDHAARSAARITASAEIPRVAIAGRPNAGKSSLLNRLTGTARAIVSATAGATRDVLSAPLTLPAGQEIILQDLAGLTDHHGRIERAADAAARSALQSADAVIWVIDGPAAAANPDHHDIPTDLRSALRPGSLTILINKTDLLPPAQADHLARRLAGRCAAAALCVSAADGAGLDQLRRRLQDVLDLSTDRSNSSIALHQQQRRALLSAVESLRRAAAELASAGCVMDVSEIIAVDFRLALADLGTISGSTVSEEVLGRIFARFCVGK